MNARHFNELGLVILPEAFGVVALSVGDVGDMATVRSKATFITRLVLFVLLGWPIGALCAEKNIEPQLPPVLRFSVPHYPPVTRWHNDQLDGKGYLAVKAIFDRLGIEMQTVKSPNYVRSFADISENLVDGVFLASSNAERLAISDPTNFVMPNRWIWVTRPQNQSNLNLAQKQNLEMGVMLNTNPHTYLVANGYKISMLAHNAETLVKALDSGRIEMAFIAEVVFEEVLEQKRAHVGDYATKVGEDKPFAIWLSKHMTKKYPELISEINKIIPSVQHLTDNKKMH